MIYISCLLYRTNGNYGYRDFIRALICSSSYADAIFIFPEKERVALMAYLDKKKINVKCIFLKVHFRSLLIQCLPYVLRLKNIDILVHTYGYGCLIGRHINQEVIVHDLQYLHPGINKSFSWFVHRTIFFSFIRDSLSSIIFFSPPTLYEYVLKFGKPKSYRICSPDYTSLMPEKSACSNLATAKQYYLVVSVGRHYKNLWYLIDETHHYNRLTKHPKQLLIITDPATANELNEAQNLPGNITVMHTISDSLLHMLFMNAFGFIQCSTYEGWSIPLDLAIRYKVPNIICNDIPIARYVCRKIPNVKFLCMPFEPLSYHI